MIGRTISHYKIVEQLGAGGMGEVYLAEDLELGREVALKLLPAEVAAEPERQERFRREARAVAALNHPNIVTVHSVEEAAGVRFLIMERVEGRTLDQLIPRGGLPLERFFEMAVPLADALAAAHEKGITHRDLKPANVMVNDEGRVKVLDFGLARLRQEAVGEEASRVPTEELTAEGRVVGTVPYMSPEQVQGKPVDHRTDIFSLGAILYEMITGERAFSGETPADTISSVLRDTPPSAADLRRDIPRHLARIIRHCLEKDRGRRLQTALDLRNELSGLEKEIESGETLLSTAGEPAARPRSWLARHQEGIVAVVLIAIFGALFVWWQGRREAAPEPETARHAAAVSSGFVPRQLSQLTFGGEVEEWPAWSPDGGRLVYSAEVEGFDNLFLRDLETGGVSRLTEGPRDDLQATWSPDGSHLLFVRSNRSDGKLEPSDVFGFFGEGDVWRLDLETGEERLLVEDSVNPSISPDGQSIAVDAAWAGPRRIWTVDAGGRNPKQLTTDSSEAVVHTAPSWSPDGSRLVFRLVETTRSDVALVDVASGEHRRLTDDEYTDLHPVWGPSGEHVYFPSYRGGGMNVWRLGVAADAGAAGAPEQLTTGAGRDVQIALSPDGRRLAFAVLQLNTDLWRLELDPETGRAAAAPQAVLATTREESRGSWSPDGGSIAFNSDRDGDMNLFVRASEGGTARPVTRGPGGDYQPRYSPDGRRLTFFSSRSGNADIWAVDLDSGELHRLTDDPGLDLNPFYSPDGRWIAFMSDRSGRLELWVMDADGGGQRQLSTIGAKSHFLCWSADGSGIYFTTEYATDPEDGPVNVFHAALEDGETTPAVHVASGGHLSLSPDGSLLLDLAGHKTLWAYPMDGSAPYEVFGFDDPEVRLDYSSWSPDGRWALFDRVDARGGDIWLLEGL